MSSHDADGSGAAVSAARGAARREAAEALIGRARSEFGEALVQWHSDLAPDSDEAGKTGGAPEGTWLRVCRDAWGETAAWLRQDEDFDFFNFLSAIDWMPSPFGRDMDSSVDNALDPPDPKPAPPEQTGVAGGDTRFQLLARVNDVRAHRSVFVKADLPEDDLRAPSWVPVYAGANWHEREAWEMFGIGFDGHPGLRHLYLPGEFEGNPLRKDYPLLARRVKPWPGIVDMELMPEENGA